MWPPALWVSSIVHATSASSSTSSGVAPTSSKAQLKTWNLTPQLPRNASKSLPALFQPYSPNTPVFKDQNLLRELSTQRNQNQTSKRSLHDRSALEKRASLPTGSCAPGSPCDNGACCSNTGVCSYAPSSCAPDVCISNCNATAPCGQYAAAGEGNCPLNVCCSQYGFCGTTSLFCDAGCQSGYGSCGPVNRPSCAGSSAESGRRIGYYESWADDSSTRLCDKRSPDDLALVGLTHLNFAFTFFDPSTFEISPMTSAAADLYKSFTGLKKKSPNLETWISLGGWSFNDDGNTPNTRTAFSDMVSNASNRRKFISALQNFMQSYGFDGVDIDWEYPAATDRGGKAADTGNFAELLAEMRSSWGTSYGISVTLPSSYWYLQGFDVVTMSTYVDWFNFMSYDIHGVWDATNQYTGPYIRPHTNLTEIEEGLDLLWMAGVEPSKVVLGLGWYGRSFTLQDSSCTSPNGVCQFTRGGNPGSCTNSAGTLSMAEIKAIQASGVATEQYDATAAVKWITWDGDQWVSFDDGVTMQQKIQAANNLCLGGVMIWSIDMDNTNGDAMNDLLGIGQANGVTEAEATDYKNQLGNATLQNSIAASCYWTLCGASCNSTYFDVTEARGQIANVQQNSVCQPGEYQTLCCAPQTTMGTCGWEGFRGVGLPCTPVCADPDATIVAQNSNSYGVDENGLTSDLTCTGGFQAYCCTGFVPSSKTNTGNMFLYGQGVFSKRSLPEGGVDQALEVLNPRGTGGGTIGTVVTASICAAAIVALIAEAPWTFGLSLIGIPVDIALCAAAGIAVTASGFVSKPSRPAQAPPKGQPKPKKPKVGSGSKPKTQIGGWPVLSYTKDAHCDCSVTYTCRYGMGWDEVCDNQRWAITKKLNGQTVFRPGANRPYSRMYRWWANNQRSPEYRTLVQLARTQPSDAHAQCQLDEFPMGDLWESANDNPQACRLVNGLANGRQGNDFKFWKEAQWMPCSKYRVGTCNKPAPPATWEFGPLNGNRGIGAGAHFVTAYGFDSQTANSLCFASYTYTDGQGKIQNTMVPDHGFRVLDDDPLYDHPYNWGRQNWKVDPGPAINAANRPTSMNSANFMRRGLPMTSYGNQSTPFEGDSQDLSSKLTCNVAGDRSYTLPEMGSTLDYDNYEFEDLFGNPIDGRACDIIYTDEDEEMQLLVNPDGRVEYIWDVKPSEDTYESPVTSAEVYVPTAEPARPSGSLPSSVPESTSISNEAVGSRATASPYLDDIEYFLKHHHNT
ncbi:hypothetical protein ASPBRDRAFT_59613 [Aspergillus brasiliensis CBS 101740]|uniref:chitinase n=1 Tax=Aspergillus brasiliensis (strain CBS 101740 / IMI 381727 / IBT 21946) TaxID=767769 RepID=A0A1L9U4A2_ASPBC|nr:hypothetical protein ASPBRDRAFT_59613 [Aspergillus brasiliensis CBS 101740]